jgi:hypothetical protein
MTPSPIPEDMRAAKRRLEQDIATPGLSLLLAAYYDPAGGFAGATFDTLGASPRNEITRDDLLAVAVLDVRWRPAAVRRLLGADSRKATDLLVGISSLTDLWLASDQRLAAIGPLRALLTSPRDGIGETTASKLLAQAPAACPCHRPDHRVGGRGQGTGVAGAAVLPPGRIVPPRGRGAPAAGSGRRQRATASRRRVVDAAQSVQGCQEGP